MNVDNVKNNGALKSDNSEDLNEKIIAVINTFKEALTKYKLNEIFLSFNGGKDCTVLLHLLVNYIKTIQDVNERIELKVIYVQPKSPFDEIEVFVESCQEYYGIDIQVVNGGSIKDVLTKVCNNDKDIKACVMGSRRSDPYCGDLSIFKKCDAGWPDLMRISPLLDWNCSHIWNYILQNDVPYCSLYNFGYTSIGDKTNTIPNPHLKRINSKDDNLSTYLPAYELINSDDLERAGRT
ncbi:unnamed protein product [Diamesa hyperborea]